MAAAQMLEMVAGLPSAGHIVVGREDISFQTIGADRVLVTVTVRNQAAGPSGPSQLLLQAAPLGAFLPWKPLQVLSVPALEADDAIEVSTEVAWPQRRPLGDFRKVSPASVRQATARGDSRVPWSLIALLAGGRPRGLRQLPRQPQVGSAAGSPVLPADLFELLGRRNPHWAGNLNVFIGGRSVERHMAQALRVYPGQTNLAMFCVGAGRDAYAFELEGDGVDWDAGLYDMTHQQTLMVDRRSDAAISEHEWLEIDGPHQFMLALLPPEDCGPGAVEVHVTQRSSGKTAVVEFSLDPAASGPGCFTL